MYIPLESRGLLKIDGPDARDFLQGLVSQDMMAVTADHAAYGAFLTPQGKFLYDFFAFELDGAVVLDCEKDRRSDFFKRLSMYKLRSDVQLADVTDDYRVFAILDETDKLNLAQDPGAATALGRGVAFTDPRLAAMGARAVLPADDGALTDAGLQPGEIDTYEQRRIELGLPDGARDMPPDKALLLENGFEELHGVSFDKGCFMGQELTARTRYRGLVKKRLLPVDIDGPAPEAGTPLMAGEKEVGEMRTSSGNRGLAVIRLANLDDGATFTAGQATLTPRVPDWVVFQKQAQEQSA